MNDAGSVHQKNWMPFVKDDELYLIFTIEPLRVMRVDTSTGQCSEVTLARTPALAALHPSPDEFRGCRGRTCVKALAKAWWTGAGEAHRGGMAGHGPSGLSEARKTFCFRFSRATCSTVTSSSLWTRPSESARPRPGRFCPCGAGEPTALLRQEALNRTRRRLGASRPGHCEVIQFVGGLHVSGQDLVRGLIVFKALCGVR